MDSDATRKTTIKAACIECGQEFIGEQVCPNDGTKLTPLSQTELIGQIVGEKYEILEVIGGGGMGLIYKARHNLMKRLVAIKMMHPRFAANALTLKRFQQEAQAASALSHPNILAVYDFGLTPEGQPYLVMDYLEGTSLAEVLDNEQFLKPDRAVHVLAQVAAGLSHAHSKGVIHRDLKPGNIMLVEFDGEKDFVKIVDFGIAKIIMPDDSETSHLTQTGEVFGSPLYMSPEQCRAKELDARSDIYSLGCVMYRTLAGSPPFIADDAMQCMFMQVHEEPEVLSEANAEACVRPELERVVLKCMAKEPADRYQTMQEVKEALEDSKPGSHSVEAQMSKTFKLPATDESTNVMEAPPIKREVKPPAGSAPNSVLELTSSSGVNMRAVADGPGTAVQASTADQQSVTDSSKQTAKVDSTPIGQLIGGTAGGAGEKNISISRSRAHGSGHGVPMKLVAIGAVVLIGIVVTIMLAVQHHNTSNLRKQLSAKEKVQAPINPDDSADALNTKAQQELDNNQYNDALATAKVALDKATKSGSKTDITEATNIMAKAHFNVGNYTESTKEFQSVIKSSGPKAKTPMLADALTGMGNIYLARQDIKNAKAYLTKGLAIREGFNGPDHAAVVDSYSSLGNMYMLEGRANESIKYLEKAVSIASNTMGESNISTAKFMNQLGEAYSYMNNLKMAESYYQKALAIRQKQLSPNDPNVADSYVCLGTLEFRKHQSDVAEIYFQKALTIYEKSIGLHNLQAAAVDFCLGVLREQRHDYDAATTFYKDAFDERSRELGPNDPKTKQAMNSYQRAKAKSGKS